MKTYNLRKSYNKKNVIKDVSFEIEKGKITSFIGPNGAGKSTVMSLISRLIFKDDGKILIDETDIEKWNSKDLSKRLAILTQSNNINTKLTVEELVEFGRFPYSKGHLSELDKKIINEAISYLELEDIRDKFIDELSGGQRQRAFIAMVIAQDTEYILLDEPTNNLDIYHATKLMKTINKLSRDLGKTIIMVIHEINYASFYSDYICAFKNGHVFKYGEVLDVITKENLKEIYDVDFEIIYKNNKPLSIHY